MAEKTAQDIQVYDGTVWKSLKGQKVYDGSDWRDFHGVYDGTDWYKLSSTTEYSGFYLVENGEIVNQHTTDTWDTIFPVNVSTDAGVMAFLGNSTLRIVNRMIEEGFASNIYVSLDIIEYTLNPPHQTQFNTLISVVDTNTREQITISETISGVSKFFNVSVNEDSTVTSYEIDAEFYAEEVFIDFVSSSVRIGINNNNGTTKTVSMEFYESLKITPSLIDIGGESSPQMIASYIRIKSVIKE